MSTVAERVQQLIRQVPNRQWLSYARTFGMPSQECMTDAVVSMVIVAAEQHRQQHGSVNVEKYLDMDLQQISDHLDDVLGLKAQREQDGADDEDDDVVSATFPGGAPGGDLGAGVGAPGDRAGVRAGEGEALPLDGAPAV